MNNNETPAWLVAFRKQEAEGNTTLRPRLIHEWKVHAGVDEAMAKQFLEGAPAHSSIVRHIAEWVLSIPSPDALRSCERCAWEGQENETGAGCTCPKCGQGTHRLPPVF